MNEIEQIAARLRAMNDIPLKDVVAMANELADRVEKLAVYPRYIGNDKDNSLVWELADGRWTFGDDPSHVLGRFRRGGRTWTPQEYVEKYGQIQNWLND